MRDRIVGAGTRLASTEARRPGAQLVAASDGRDIRGAEDAADEGDDENFDDGAEDEDEDFDDIEEDEVDDGDEGDEEVADGEVDEGDEDEEEGDDEEEDEEEIADGDDDDDADPYRFLLEEDDRAPNLEEWSPSLVSGRIEILDKLKEGAMGAVWRGRHLKLERPVAVKVLDESLKLRADGRERFLREARALARLDHPNIVRVYDCDELPDGNLYLCMELLDGETLRDVFQRGKPLGALEVIDIGRQICDAVGTAHQQGILHRDLTPSNIMRLRDASRTIKVIDWGLCKYLDLFYQRPVPEPGAPPGSCLVTPLGARFGTPEYLAPEMILRENPRPPSFRTDVFSLAVVLYELLTARHPFAPGERREPRPICDALPGFEYEELETALRQAMHFEPEKRTPTMAEFREALDLARGRVLAPRVPDGAPHVSRVGEGEAIAMTSSKLVAATSGASLSSDDSARVARLPVEQPWLGGRSRGTSSIALHAFALVFIAGVGTGVLGLLIGQRIGAIPATIVVLRDTPPREAPRPVVPQAAPPVVAETRDTPASMSTSLAAVPERAAVEPASLAVPAPAVLASTDAPRPRARSSRPSPSPTFSSVLANQKKKLVACAKKTGVTEESVTVQVRYKGNGVDGVRVLKLSKEHPFSSCVDDVVRDAKPPRGASPIEDFTFSAR
nr:serine/threonine-protein kinase [Nannocystis sp. ILAH1]